MATLRPLTTAALLGAAALSLTLSAHAVADRQRVDTRYGTVEVRENPAGAEVLFKGQVVRRISALGASLYKGSSHGEHEYVVVEMLKRAGSCGHAFVFLEVFANGTAQVSKDFGECRELRAVEFNGAGQPFLRLQEQYAAGAAASQNATADYVWKDGQIVQVAGSAAANAASARAIAQAAAAASAAVPLSESEKRVIAERADPRPAGRNGPSAGAGAVDRAASMATPRVARAPEGAGAAGGAGMAGAALAAVAAVPPAPPSKPALAAATTGAVVPAVARVEKGAAAARPGDGKPSIQLARAVVPASSAGKLVNDGTPLAAGAAAAAPGTSCDVAASAGKSSGQAVASSNEMRQVGGKGRLQFFTAPAAGCEKRGLFVVTGDLLDAHTVYQNFTFVRYVNPKNGRAAEGWVPSERLTAPSRTLADKD